MPGAASSADERLLRVLNRRDRRDRREDRQHLADPEPVGALRDHPVERDGDAPVVDRRIADAHAAAVRQLDRADLLVLAVR